jgi:hypothetical protein
MKRIAIMQPYVFPYIGYFQLIHAVDMFVFYNDVNFIKKGWINRNAILLDGRAHKFTIPCADVSQNRLICDTHVAFDESEKKKFFATLEQAYKKAPYFNETFSLVRTVLSSSESTIDRLAISSIIAVCQELDIKTRLVVSSERYQNRELRREERLIDICTKENANEYVNPIGGAEIYSKEFFKTRGVDLYFQKPRLDAYKQFDNDFVPGLSVIDVLMFNDRKKISGYLHSFELL